MHRQELSAAPSFASTDNGPGTYNSLVRLSDLIPTDLMVRLVHADGMAHAVLHGNATRGYMGLISASLLKPCLILKSAASDPLIIRIIDGWIGGPETPVTSPWASTIFRVPAGSYRLTFAVDEVVVEEKSIGAVKVNLEGLVVFR